MPDNPDIKTLISKARATRDTQGKIRDALADVASAARPAPPAPPAQQSGQ